MNEIHRTSDITPIEDDAFAIYINRKKVFAAPGETVLSVMMATNVKQLMENDHQNSCGAYCGMGICHSCHVKINGRYKQRACQVVVESNMQINTQANRFQAIGVDK